MAKARTNGFAEEASVQIVWEKTGHILSANLRSTVERLGGEKLTYADIVIMTKRGGYVLPSDVDSRLMPFDKLFGEQSSDVDEEYGEPPGHARYVELADWISMGYNMAIALGEPSYVRVMQFGDTDRRGRK